MNLTLDIDRKYYFPQIWWKQPVSINKIVILKTASTVLGYIPKKLTFAMAIGLEYHNFAKKWLFRNAFLKVWQHFTNYLMISWSKQNLTLSKNQLAITDLKTNFIISLIKSGSSISLERNINPFSFAVHLRKYHHPPPPPPQQHTKMPKKLKSNIC